MKKVEPQLLGIIDKVNDRVGTVVAYLIYLMVFLVFSEVVLRYVWNAPTTWSLELPQMIFGGYAMLAGGYCLLHGSHVSVDVFYERGSPRVKAILDIVGLLVLLAVCGLLLYWGGKIAWTYTVEWRHSQTAWAPPVAPLMMAIPLGALLLILQGLAKFIRSLVLLSRGSEERR